MRLKLILASLMLVATVGFAQAQAQTEEKPVVKKECFVDANANGVCDKFEAKTCANGSGTGLPNCSEKPACCKADAASCAAKPCCKADSTACAAKPACCKAKATDCATAECCKSCDKPCDKPCTAECKKACDKKCATECKEKCPKKGAKNGKRK